MAFLPTAVPWGSLVVESIPLPPFSSAEEHRRYTLMLQLHLALLDRSGSSLPTVALSSAINVPQWHDNVSPWLTPLELSVSLDTWFPAPWTPASLAQTMANASADGPVRSGSVWSWGHDPDYSAAPERDGSWTITRRERRHIDTERVASDRDLVITWIDYFRNSFVVPWGVAYSEEDLAALTPASRAVLAADAADAAYPYRSDWARLRTELLGES